MHAQKMSQNLLILISFLFLCSNETFDHLSRCRDKMEDSVKKKIEKKYLQVQQLEAVEVQRENRVFVARTASNQPALHPLPM